MKTLAVVSQKGGVGKTTLATALAVEAVRRGQSVVIVDLDPQASASFWKDTREESLFEDPLAITAVPASRLGHVISAAENAGCDLVVIDTPPFSKDIAYEATQRADFVLIPTRPAVLDVMAMTRSLELVKHYERPYAIAITFCPHQGREVEDTARAIRDLDAELCPVRIGSRIAYSRAQQTGRAAQEIDPEGKAAQEISSLYDYMAIHIGGNGQEGRRHG